MGSQYLLIAIGMSTTGPDVEKDEILEIAAKLVLPSNLQAKNFSTPLSFHSQVHNESTKNEILMSMINTEETYQENLKSFLEWLQLVIREARRNSENYLVTALIGHFAFWREFRCFVKYDFDNCQDLMGLWCHYADSGDLFGKLKRLGLWDYDGKLTVEAIYKHLTGEKITDGNGASYRANGLYEILSLPNVQQYFKFLDVIDHNNFKEWCENSNSSLVCFEDLMNKFGPHSVYVNLLQTLSMKQITSHKVLNVYCRSRNNKKFKEKMFKCCNVELTNDDSVELYRACKGIWQSCNCCISTFPKK